MTDRELLELAAKAAGYGAHWDEEYDRMQMCYQHKGGPNFEEWNPLEDDGDALRLAVKLRMNVRVEDYGASARIDGKPHGAWSGCEAHLHGGIYAATRRCIVRAAVAIGQQEGE